MAKNKGSPPEKMTERLIVRFTKTQRALIKSKAASAGICDTDYVRALAIDTPVGRVRRAMTIDHERAQKINIAFSKWGEVLQRVYECAQVGEIPYESLMEQLYLSYQELHTAVLEMIEASR